MRKFDYLGTICEVLTWIGWLAIPVGALTALSTLKSEDLITGTVGLTLIGSGISTVLVAGAVKVLIAIYQNTCPKDVVEATPASEELYL